MMARHTRQTKLTTREGYQRYLRRGKLLALSARLILIRDSYGTELNLARINVKRIRKYGSEKRPMSLVNQAIDLLYSWRANLVPFLI